MERRFTKGVQLRARDGGKPGIEGYGAVFGPEYVLYDSPTLRIVERVAPGTFTRTIAEKQDVRCLFNHEPDNLLARTTNNTLSLRQDDKGLYFSADFDDTDIATRVAKFIQRKDVTGCSFSFVVTKQTRTETEENDKLSILRVIEDVDTFDVGPVTFPAYEETSVNGRSISRRELRSIFPEGIPANVLAHAPSFKELRDAEDGDPGGIPNPDDGGGTGDPDGDVDDPAECECDCRACFSAECNECDMHMETCGDGSNCNGMMDARAKRDDGKKTKRVDGEDLPASSFLYVGDPDKTATWSLPWKFSTDAKTKSHLQNALARFSQTKNIPADKKPAVYKKLVAKCKQYGIHVSGEDDSDSKSADLELEYAQARSRTLALAGD